MEKSEEEYLNKKIEEVIANLKSRGQNGILVAFSGGVDSSLLALLAKMAVGERAVALTMNSPTLPPGELEGAKKVAEEIGIKHLVVEVNELANPEFARNPNNRCYFCKKELIFELQRVAVELGIGVIVVGVIAEDLESYRPGISALREAGIHMPLAEAGLRKRDVRGMARILGLSVADKPSMACLSSRIAYGEEITEPKLRMIGEAESYIKRLLNVTQVRVRLHGNLARIEVPPRERRVFFDEAVMDKVFSELRSMGFIYVTLDLGGYRSGSMDEAFTRIRLNPWSSTSIISG